MKVGVFGSEYQEEKQNVIKRLFEKLIEKEAEIYVDYRFHIFLTDVLN
ncbi:MAG TPA: NAD kinase, partial [Porphyromonadaceae bacterium]|nr:NAD kinase [Porphyromonadaceae bacterium]